MGKSPTLSLSSYTDIELVEMLNGAADAAWEDAHTRIPAEAAGYLWLRDLFTAAADRIETLRPKREIE